MIEMCGQEIRSAHSDASMVAEERLDRFRRFWAIEATDRPTVGFQVGPSILERFLRADSLRSATSQPISPDLVAPEAILPHYGQQWTLMAGVEQDSFWSAQPLCGFPWLELMTGCAICGSPLGFVSAGVVAIRTPAECVLDTDGAWAQRLLGITTRLAQASGGRFPISGPTLSGIADTLGARVGAPALARLLRQDIEFVRECAHHLTGGILRIVQQHRDATPDFLGGSCLGSASVWAPGSSWMTRDRLATFLGPDLYVDAFLASHRRIWEATNYSVFQLDPGALHILDALLAEGSLRAIEVVQHPNGPSIRDMLPALHAIQTHRKGLIIQGMMNKDDIDDALQGLSHAGLHLTLFSATAEEARFWMRYILEQCRRAREER